MSSQEEKRETEDWIREPPLLGSPGLALSPISCHWLLVKYLGCDTKAEILTRVNGVFNIIQNGVGRRGLELFGCFFPPFNSFPDQNKIRVGLTKEEEMYVRSHALNWKEEGFQVFDRYL